MILSKLYCYEFTILQITMTIYLLFFRYDIMASIAKTVPNISYCTFVPKLVRNSRIIGISSIISSLYILSFYQFLSMLERCAFRHATRLFFEIFFYLILRPPS